MRDNEARNERIRALVANGWTYSEVAAKLGCTRNVVSGVIMRANGYRRSDPPKGYPRGDSHRQARLRQQQLGA